MENQRLPQRVRLFKFLEGDLHRQIKLLDRPRRKDNRELRLYSKGGRVEIRGFGSFCLNYRPPRQGRNPKTGAKVIVSAKHVPHFKAGKELRERVDIK